MPQDNKPSQTDLIRPEEIPEGWELLRDPMDIEYWEQTDFVALVADVKTRGEVIELTAQNLRVIGQIVKQMQLVFALDSRAFREWIRSHGSFEDATVKLLPLVYAYANALGEVGSSAS